MQNQPLFVGFTAPGLSSSGWRSGGAVNRGVGLSGQRALPRLAELTPLLCSQPFARFARTEAIQRTEILEYCQQLRQPRSFLLPFQVEEMHEHIWCSSPDLPQNMLPPRRGQAFGLLSKACPLPGRREPWASCPCQGAPSGLLVDLGTRCV